MVMYRTHNGTDDDRWSVFLEIFTYDLA